MRCAQVDRLVERLVDGALENSLAWRIEAHARSCLRCTGRIQTARGVVEGFTAPRERAPSGFSARVMDAVYREALAGAPRLAAMEKQPARSPGVPARMYRRLGLSLLLTAGVLTASLFVPRAAYPGLLGVDFAAAGFSRGSSAAVRGALNGADSAVRGILREHAHGGSGR
jgi:hypothetical protein